MLEIADLDLDQLITALGDQDGGSEHIWMIDPATGQITFATRDVNHSEMDIDGSNLSLAGDGAGLGTLGLPEGRLRDLATQVGLSGVRRLPVDDPFNNVYELTA